MLISSSVGRAGGNRADDARLVQRLLNNVAHARESPMLMVDGVVGPKTIAAIESFQRSFGLPVDGRIDANGPSIRKLADQFVATIAHGLIRPASATHHGGAPLPDLKTMWDKVAHGLKS
jgi:peptidoglycan hydrolase-like protein with peptidoglycan-binding domain